MREWSKGSTDLIVATDELPNEELRSSLMRS